MANLSHPVPVVAFEPFPGTALDLAGPWAQLARKIAALNLDTARAAMAETTEYFLESVTQPLSFGMFRPELAEVVAQHVAAYTNGLQDILAGAQAEFTGELQRQFAAISGQDPFQWCLMGRDFLPDSGGTLPAMGAAMHGWFSAYLPGDGAPSTDIVEPVPRKTSKLSAPRGEPAVDVKHVDVDLDPDTASE